MRERDKVREREDVTLKLRPPVALQQWRLFQKRSLTTKTVEVRTKETHVSKTRCPSKSYTTWYIQNAAETNFWISIRSMRFLQVCPHGGLARHLIADGLYCVSLPLRLRYILYELAVSIFNGPGLEESNPFKLHSKQSYATGFMQVS